MPAFEIRIIAVLDDVKVIEADTEDDAIEAAYDIRLDELRCRSFEIENAKNNPPDYPDETPHNLSQEAAARLMQIALKPLGDDTETI